MTSFGDRYPRQGGTFLKADHLRGKPDLVVQIERVDLDTEAGNKVLDVVRFKDCEYSLVLNQTTGTTIASLYGDQIEDWQDNWIALFCDDSVEFTDKNGNDHKGGIRVRPFMPHGKERSARPAEARKPAAASFHDDGIPF
jgi:hypothetical protein